MKFLMALLVAASLPVFGADSTNAPVKAELDKVPEARQSVSAVQIAGRLRRTGDAWLLNEQDREKLALTNQRGKVCAGAVVSKLAPYGLFVEHESGAFWCGWSQLPLEVREKYQVIAAQAQKNHSPKTINSEASAPVDQARIANERARKQEQESAANNHYNLFVKAKEELREVKTQTEYQVWKEKYWGDLTREERNQLNVLWVDQLKSEAAHQAGLKAIQERKN